MTYLCEPRKILEHSVHLGHVVHFVQREDARPKNVRALTAYVVIVSDVGTELFVVVQFDHLAKVEPTRAKVVHEAWYLHGQPALPEEPLLQFELQFRRPVKALFHNEPGVDCGIGVHVDGQRVESEVLDLEWLGTFTCNKEDRVDNANLS